MLCNGVEISTFSGSEKLLCVLTGHKRKRSRSARPLLGRPVASDDSERVVGHRRLKLLHAFSWQDMLDKKPAGRKSVS